MEGHYSIRVTARVEPALQRLPEKLATAYVEFIYGPLADNPHRVGKPLRGELVGLRSARRGDYRVIYGVVENTRTVEIVHLDRRSDIYRQ